MFADETLRSVTAYGTSGFPFACFLGEFGQGEEQAVPLHWHREAEIVLVTEGTVLCRVGGEETLLSAGDGVFINSGAIHRLAAHGYGRQDSLVFAPELLAAEETAIYQRYVAPILSAGPRWLPLRGARPEDAPLLTLLTEACRQARGAGYGSELRVRDSISRLWLALAERLQGSLDKENFRAGMAVQVRLQQMLDYIQTNYRERILLEDIAAAASISKSAALRCFHEGLRTTPVKYLGEYRLARARELLLSSADPVTAVAEAAGFDSAGYFCQAFRARYGVPPGELRRQRQRYRPCCASAGVCKSGC